MLLGSFTLFSYIELPRETRTIDTGRGKVTQMSVISGIICVILGRYSNTYSSTC